MAYTVNDLNGAVVSPSATYPYGALKNAPSGTLVDFTMMDDMWQTFQKAMAEAGVVPNNLPDNAANGWQCYNAFQIMTSRYAAQWIISQLGENYDNTKVYVLYGTAGTTASYIFYNSNIYYLRVPAPGPCTDVLVIRTDGLMFNGILSANVYCGLSGSGIANLADVIYINNWVDCSADISFSGATVAIGDIVYARYLLRGKTVTVQINLEQVTVAGGVSTIDIDFVGAFPSNVVNLGADLVVGFSAGNGVLVGTFSGVTPVLSVIKASGGNFTSGTDNQFFSIAFTVELA